jgi:hypothetical protein
MGTSMTSDQLSSDTSTNSNLSTRQTVTLIGLAGLATFLLAVIPGLSFVNYSFRLLITLVHELGHGLGALITGGEFLRFEISPDGSGLAYTAGGWRFVVIPAGYLGSALFGAVLILLGRSHRWSRTAMAVIGGAMVLFSLRYGVPTIFTSHILSGILTTVSGVIFGSLFLWVAIKATPSWIIFLLHMVAIQAGLMAFSDIITVIGLSANFMGAANSDAQSMAELTLIPAIVWAILWAIVALVVIAGAIWKTWIGPSRSQNH